MGVTFRDVAVLVVGFLKLKRAKEMTRALLAFCLLLLLPLKVDADLGLFFDNFDSENNGTFDQNYDAFSQWNVTRGAVDLIGNGDFDFFPGNGLYVDMDGSNLTGPGRLETKSTFDLIAGNTYTLQFDLGNTDDRFGGDENPNEMIVTIGSFSEAFLRTSVQDFETIVRTITPTMTLNDQTLSFDHLGDRDAIGLLIDNVQLTCNGCAIPEPSSFLLFCGACVVTILSSRRKAVA